MGKVVSAARNMFKTPKTPTIVMPEPEKPVPMASEDSIQTRMAGMRQRAEASQRSGRDSTMLSEQRLGDQGSPMRRTGLAGSSVITG